MAIWTEKEKQNFRNARHICGLTRIPGTYNVATKAYSSFQTVHEIRMDLPKMYDTISAARRIRNLLTLPSAALRLSYSSVWMPCCAFLPYALSKKDVGIFSLCTCFLLHRWR